jgi:hypothetical protein
MVPRLEAADGEEAVLAELPFGMPISKWFALRRRHIAAGSEEDCMSGGGIPFAGGAESCVDVRLTFGNPAELERRAQRAAFLDGRSGKKRVHPGVRM